MANPEHIKILQQGANKWNKWREERSSSSLLGGSDIATDDDLSNVDLRGLNLQGADLSLANLSRVDFSGANLSHADLRGADLSFSDLSKVNFSSANLNCAHFSGANLSHADLIAANLSFSDLSKVNFSNANLSHADLNCANLSNADLIAANLSFSDLIEVNFSSANLSHADLNCANLSNANLIGANLSLAKLSYDTYLIGANFIGANLSHIRLSYADLSGFNFSNANFTCTEALGTNFKGAIFTGICLEDWHINNQTNLDEIICDYVYQRNDRKERRPSSGNFQVGDFTRLYQKAIETLDLIFQDGIDWKSFAATLQELNADQKLNIEGANSQLTVRAIEKRDDGSFVIRVDVPSSIDKAKIESSFKNKYKKQLRAQEKQ